MPGSGKRCGRVGVGNFGLGLTRELFGEEVEKRRSRGKWASAATTSAAAAAAVRGSGKWN
jgi:hypothetical protein